MAMHRVRYAVIVGLWLLVIAPAHAQLFGDINGDGVVNAIDVQLVINAALGMDTSPYNADINGDSVVNAVDVQLVINAALGIFPSNGQDLGTLRLVHDLPTLINALHVFPSGADDWGVNLLDAPLAQNDIYQGAVEPGIWDIGVVDSGLVRRVQTGVEILPHHTIEVRVSEMQLAESGVSGLIGANGGWLEVISESGHLAHVSFGPGAVPAGTMVHLNYASADDPWAHSPRWTLHIDHGDLCGPVSVFIEGLESSEQPLYFMLADSLTTAVDSTTMRPLLIEAIMENGTALLEIPPHEDCAAGKFSRSRMEKDSPSIRSSFTFWAVSGYLAEQTANFRLTYPSSILVESSDLPAYILTSAELAYTKLKNMGFQFRADLNWPVNIAVKHGMGDTEGEVSIPLSGKANTSININADLCTPAKLLELRAVIGHEFFHVVQVAHDPRNSVRIRHAWTVGYFNWLGEASSVWFEARMIENPNHVAAPFLEQAPHYYHRGLETYTSKQTAMERGYAAAGFMRYLTEQRGDAVVRGAWEAVRGQGSGYDPYSDLSALITGVGSGFETGRQFAQYMGKFLTSTTGYPGWPWFPVRQESAYQESVAVTPATSEVEIRASIEPFAANRWRIFFEDVEPNDDHYRLEAIEDDSSFYYEVYRAQTLPGGQITPLQYATSLAKDVPWHFSASPGDLVAVVAVNVDDTPPYTEPQELAVQLTRGRVHNVTQDLWHTTIAIAVDAADEGDELVAYPGTHECTAQWGCDRHDVPALMIRKPVTLRSLAGPDETVLAVSIGATEGIELSGFTVASFVELSGGASSITGNRFTRVGSPIPVLHRFLKVKDGAAASITENALEYLDGGEDDPSWRQGILIVDGGQVTISRNSIIACVNGITVRGTAANGMAQVLISDNQIMQHRRWGIEVRANYGDWAVTIQDNLISDNGLAGIELSHHETGSNAVITGNTVTGNSFAGIRTSIWRSHCTVSGNTIERNVGDWGGGVSLARTTVLENNIIKDNHALHKGGGVYGRASGWELREEIITDRGITLDVIRYSPCFPESTNTYSGNTHGETFGAWGPGEDNWCDDAGYDVYMDYWHWK